MAEPPSPSPRDAYAREAMRSIPKLLQLADRNPFSPTYGCFDRSYWHYRTMDFPCGMYQEFVLPLALAYNHPFVDNPYCGKKRVAQLAEAGIDYARRSSRRDSSCDDYFPFERALGAAVFSLYAMTEAYQTLDLRRPDLVDFFARRGQWLARHQETGRLSNHQALAAVALYNVYLLTREERFRRASEDKKRIALSWQHEEGWFQEYEGADPGYQTCSIDFLAKLWKKSGAEDLLQPLERATRFAWHFAHPDGSYGGEYGSRNTYHFYPHGFELLASRLPEAGQLADHFLKVGLPRGTRYFNEDDRMCCHYVYNWLQAWLDYWPDRPPDIRLARPFERWFPGAKLFVKKTACYHAVAAMNKGGVIKAFDQDGCVASDTGLIARLEDGSTLVSHLIDGEQRVDADPQQGLFRVEGRFSRRRQPLPTPFKQILFRLFLLTIGRLSANLARRLLQKLLITAKSRTSIRFRRTLHFEPDQIAVRDEIEAPPNTRFSALACGSDATSIYVANSNVYQASVLREWADLSAHLQELNRAGRVSIKRQLVGPPDLRDER